MSSPEIRPATPKQLAGLGLALVLATLSCGREPTAPQGGDAARYSHALSWISEFPPALPLFQAAGGSGVDFTSVRIVLNNPDGTVALDTVVNFPAGASEFELTLSVPLPASAPASGQPLALNLEYKNAAGNVVFRGGPVTVNAVPRAASGAPPPAAPVTIPLTYTGPGANAVSVRISPKTLTVNTGGTFNFSAVALDAAGNPVPNTPIIFASQNQALAVINAATGAGTAGGTRGNVDIVAQLLTGQTDAASLTIQSPAAAIALFSGSGQTGPVNSTLPNPVVVKVTATDGLPSAGVAVTFAAQNGGMVGASTVTTDAAGNAQTTWKLGSAPGAQTLTATAAGLSGSPVTFTATARSVDPVRVQFTTQPPASTAAGSSLTPAVTVAAVDATGAVSTAFTGPITIGLAPGAPIGAALTGTLTVNAAAGIATFADLKVSTPGTYSLIASATGLIAATSNSFQIVAGTANRAVFQAYPVAGAVAGSALDAITVHVRDVLGNAVTTFTGAVTLTANGPISAAAIAEASVTDSSAAAGTAAASTGDAMAQALIGATTVNAVSGVATFTGLKLNAAGSYTLSASAAGIATVVGPAFVITPGPASTLVLVSGGGQSAVGGAAVASPVVVQVTDGLGNGIGGVTLTFAPALGSGTANPASAVTSALGFAQTTWTLGGVAGVNTLNVSGSGLAPNPLAVGATVTVTTVAGPATRLAFSTQPTTSAAATGIAPAIVIAAKDAGGLIATTFTGNVTLVIAANANPGSGTLAGTTTVAAVAGVATFPGLSINNTGVGYKLVGTAGGLTPDTSATFNISGGAIVSTLFAAPKLDSLYSFGDFITRVPVSKDASTTVVPGTYVYASRNAGVATVTAAGLITAVANGSTYIVATEAGGTKDSTLVVVQQRIATISVTPGTRNIYRTRTFQFAASAVDGRGNPMAAAIAWSSLATGTATVDGTGLVTAVSLGGTQIRATAGAISGVSNITVLTPITRIVVGRDSSGVPVTDTSALPSLGIRRAMRAEARDTLDAPMTGITFTWGSTNSSVATIDSAFATRSQVLSNANGNTAIQATADGVTGSAALKVQQVLASIELTPTPDTIGITGSVQLTARGKDANDRYITGGSFTYASAAPAIATVNSTTGVVSGVALGATNVTAASGAITSNNAVIVVSTTVPAAISFGRDTLTVGRGSGVSIPVFLSRPNGSNVTVNLAARDTNAYFSVGSITFTPGQTAQNVTLNGRNAGTTVVYATDGSGTGFTGDTAAVAVQANVRFAQTGWTLNATDQVASQVLLSDPSPAGGTFVTFSYGTAGRASVSPDPAFIPAGQLAANVVITALGSTNGSTTIMPVATGVNGTASTLTVYAPVLNISAGASARLGAGQYESGWYVYTPTSTVGAIPLTFTSTDTSVVVASPATGAIPAGSNYQYFTVSGKIPGTAKVIVSAAGWTPDTLTMTITSPRTTISATASLVTTSPVQNATVYVTDSVGNGHYRTNALALSISSSDTTVIKIIDKTPSVPVGQYYASGIRFQPGGSGGTAYIKVVAGGHAPDSVLVTVVGPKLEFSWNSNQLGKGQYDQNLYVYTPNSVVNPLTVTLVSANSAKVSVPASVTIPAGLNYAYFNVTGVDTSTSTSIIASAAGYQGDTSYYRVSSPRLYAWCGTTLNNFGPGASFCVQTSDSVNSGHYRSTPLAVTLTSTNPAVVTVDSATVTIGTGAYYTTTPRVSVVGIGSAYIVATAAGHRPDSSLYTVQTPKLNFSWGTAVVGLRQSFGSNAFYVYTPDNRTSPLAVTFTQSAPGVDSLSVSGATIPNGTNYQYFTAAGKALGVDTIIASAAGYLPDTAVIRVSSPRFYYAGGLPGSAATTNPPSTVTLYATDSLNSAHYPLDTVIARVVSSDTTVIRPSQRTLQIPKGQYYGQLPINYTGPGTASLAFSDTTGAGYTGTTSNTVTVTGPSLVFNNTNAIYGMRQRGSSGDYYIYTQNNVASPLTVNLVSTDTTVATAPSTVTIPTGSNYVYFTITAQSATGTIQIQANAAGYGPPTPINVQVTQPKFVFSVNTSTRTTGGPQTITVYAADANGNVHYVTESVTMNLASSSGAVFTVDSSSVTIPAGQYYHNTARWIPVAAGSAQLTATDPRAATWKYNTATANLSVTTPNLGFSWNNAVLGLGQYIDSNYDVGYYVATTDYQAAPLTVALSHVGVARAATLASVTVPTSNYYAYVRLTGSVRGTDTLVASAASPFHNPDTAYTVVDSGRVDGIIGWPAGPLAVGDSVAITLRTLDPNASSVRRVVAATTFSLAPNANIEFRSGGAGSVVITSATVPADGSQVTFYVKALAAGAGAATITNANYRTYSPPAITIP